MTEPLSRYPWPQIPGSGTPVWTGKSFQVNGTARAVIPYSDTSSAWSAELTELHEQEAGDGRHPIDVASRELALSTLKRLRVKDPVVLDVGCSSGWFLRDLKAESLYHAIGADYIAPPLEGLAKRLPGVPLLQFDLRDCPLPSASLDAVVALNVLEHIDDDERALSHIARILKTGGLAHIEVPASPSSYDVYDEHLMHHRRYRLSDLKAKMTRAGLRILRGTHLGFIPFPAFWIAKQRNKPGSLSKEQMKERVARDIRATGDRSILGMILPFDRFLAEHLPLPFGIRCVAVAEKA